MTTQTESIARDTSPRYETMIAESPAMRRIAERAERVAKADLAVLLTGESGTGKEVTARLIHAASGRRGAFIALNCAGLEATFADRELFGHRRGTFTGADRDGEGLCQAAAHGTLFLDEVGELGSAVQAKLLRVLSGGDIRRLGATTSEPMSARIIAATNRDLEEEVLCGRFREDLFHRLAAVRLELPPLRMRREEIPILVERFLIALGQPNRKVRVAPRAFDSLTAYDWPGNVRELRQAVARALVFGSETLQIEDFDLGGGLRRREQLPPEILFGRWSEVERAAVAEALERHGTIRGAARALGRPKSTVADLVRRFGLRGRSIHL